MRNVALLLGLVAACGGEVTIGTLAAADGGAPAETPPAPRAPDAPPTTPGSCGAVNGVEVLYDVAANGDEGVSDFFGDGEHVFVGINNQGNPAHGRIARLPASGGDGTVVAVDGETRSVGPALDRVVFGVFAPVSDDGTTAGPPGGLGVVPPSGGKAEQQNLGSPPMFASHAQSAEAFYVTVQFLGDRVQSWNPPAPPKLAIDGTNLYVRSLSVGATGLAVVVQKVAADANSFMVIRPPGADPVVYEVIATIDAPWVSNVVADGDNVFLAAKDSSAAKVIVYRFDYQSTGQSLANATRIGEVPAGPSDRVHIEVDDTHVYLSRGVPDPNCYAQTRFCSAPLEVTRMKKDGSATSNAPVKVKEFVGASPAAVHFRSFNVDACWFYWYDSAKRIFYRQPKSAL